MTHDYETAQEIFRQRVLAAMDKAAWEILGRSITRNDCGSTDEDLPRLFPAIDEQLDVISKRFNHALYRDGYIGSDKYNAERKQLKGMGFKLERDTAA